MSIALSRQTGHLNTTIEVIVTSSGSGYTPGTPGSPSFSVTGGTGASVSSQVVTANNTATLQIATGSATGVLTISDGTDTATITLRPSTWHKWYPGLARTGRRLR